MLYLHSRGSYIQRIARLLGISTQILIKNEYAPVIARKNKLLCPINWGCSSALISNIDNHESIMNYDISIAVSKVRTFRALNEVGILTPTYSKDVQNISTKGRYLARKDFSYGGKGIEVVEKDRLPLGTDYDFYSLVIAKKYEFRVHVFLDRIICTQFKFIPSGSNILIRNHDNGARFSSKPLNTHLSDEQAQTAHDIALRSIEACGLDFGAVDMALSQKNNIYVLEVNTAPGISATDNENPLGVSTHVAYTRALEQLFI